MIVLRRGQVRRLTMEAIESYFSLGHNSLKVDRDLLYILGMKSRDKDKLTAELAHTSLTLDDIAELRKKAADCGLMQYYYDMTPDQINEAYEGHCRTMMDLGNLAVVAIRKAFTEDSEPFVYQKQATREETLRSVGL